MCPTCGQTGYIEKEVTNHLKYDGKRIIFNSIRATCGKCRELIFIRSIHKENIRRINKAITEEIEANFAV